MSDTTLYEVAVLLLWFGGVAGVLAVAGSVVDHISPRTMRRIEKALFGLEEER